MRPEAARAAKQLTVIGIALLTGVVFFLTIMIAVGGFRSEPVAKAGVIAWLAVGMGVVLFVVSHIVPKLIAHAQLTQLSQAGAVSTGQLLDVFRSKSIVAMGLAEGGAFFNIIAYYLEGQLLNLGVVVLLATRMALQLPSGATIEAWVTDQERSHDQDLER